jgi:HAD superfamily hydrolase (TIGR01509 family)
MSIKSQNGSKMKTKEIVLVFDLDLTLYNSADFVDHKSPSLYYKSFNEKKMLVELLTRLPFRKYILTNASHSHAVAVSKSLGIHHCIKGILSMDMYNVSKPDPRIYTKACSLFSLDPEKHDIWFFEDQHINLRPAKEMFGWHTVYIYDDMPRAMTKKFQILPPYIDYQFGRVEHALSFLFHPYFTGTSTSTSTPLPQSPQHHLLQSSQMRNTSRQQAASGSVSSFFSPLLSLIGGGSSLSSRVSKRRPRMLK